MCIRDRAKYLQKALPTGSMYDSIPFEQEFSEKKAKRIAAQLETALWQGDTSSVNVNLNKFDGLIKLIGAASGVVDANTSTFISGAPLASITAANVISIFDGVYRAIPATIVSAEDVVIVCGMDTFRTYTIALKNSNLFHYSIDVKADNEFILPGTTIKVVALQGLNGTNDVFAMRLSNLFLGTDLLNEEDKFEIFYAKEADQVRFVSEFKMACALTQGYVLDCKDSLGGITEVLFIASKDVTATTEVSGVITAVTKAAGKRFYKYELVKETSSFVENVNASVENGSIFYQQELTVILNKLQANTRNEILLLAQNLLVAVVKDNNGKYWYLGKTRGLDITGGSAGSGTAMGDRSGYTLTFTAKEPELTPEVSSSIITGLLS